MLGLALEGGGAKGAYEIGAYRALTELVIILMSSAVFPSAPSMRRCWRRAIVKRPRNFGRRPPMTICSLRRTKAFWKSSTGR